MVIVLLCQFMMITALPVYDERYIKTKIRTCLDKVSTHFRGLYEPEDDVEYESFTIVLCIPYLSMKTNTICSDI